MPCKSPRSSCGFPIPSSLRRRASSQGAAGDQSIQPLAICMQRPQIIRRGRPHHKRRDLHRYRRAALHHQMLCTVFGQDLKACGNFDCERASDGSSNTNSTYPFTAPVLPRLFFPLRQKQLLPEPCQTATKEALLQDFRDSVQQDLHCCFCA